jgi:hypothetical protein
LNTYGYWKVAFLLGVFMAFADKYNCLVFDYGFSHVFVEPDIIDPIPTVFLPGQIIAFAPSFDAVTTTSTLSALTGNSYDYTLVTPYTLRLDSQAAKPNLVRNKTSFPDLPVVENATRFGSNSLATAGLSTLGTNLTQLHFIIVGKRTFTARDSFEFFIDPLPLAISILPTGDFAINGITSDQIFMGQAGYTMTSVYMNSTSLTVDVYYPEHHVITNNDLATFTVLPPQGSILARVETYTRSLTLSEIALFNTSYTAIRNRLVGGALLNTNAPMGFKYFELGVSGNVQTSHDLIGVRRRCTQLLNLYHKKDGVAMKTFASPIQPVAVVASPECRVFRATPACFPNHPALVAGTNNVVTTQDIVSTTSVGSFPVVYGQNVVGSQLFSKKNAKTAFTNSVSLLSTGLAGSVTPYTLSLLNSPVAGHVFVTSTPEINCSLFFGNVGLGPSTYKRSTDRIHTDYYLITAGWVFIGSTGLLSNVHCLSENSYIPGLGYTGQLPIPYAGGAVTMENSLSAAWARESVFQKGSLEINRPSATNIAARYPVYNPGTSGTFLTTSTTSQGGAMNFFVAFIRKSKDLQGGFGISVGLQTRVASATTPLNVAYGATLPVIRANISGTDNTSYEHRTTGSLVTPSSNSLIKLHEPVTVLHSGQYTYAEQGLSQNMSSIQFMSHFNSVGSALLPDWVTM